MMQALESQGCSPGCVWFSCPACRPLDHLIRCPRDSCSALHAIDALASGWVICDCGVELCLVSAQSARRIATEQGATVRLALVATYTDALGNVSSEIAPDRLCHLAITRGKDHVPQALLARPGAGLLEGLYPCPFCPWLHVVGDEQCHAQRTLH